MVSRGSFFRPSQVPATADELVSFKLAGALATVKSLVRPRRRGLQLWSPIENPYCSCNGPLLRIPTAAVS